ncbi:1-(5-phosphoribosyl)-5-[(5-phosphoribosylamino)methylideneamino]imidazole-4-carboxamide isomerase [Synechococcales cyanobacterium C]|uniref:1-(5-phosphoribosyl)-5-[(5-phosphoribosylamino)methylideneamino] imidazole-4-carboxamide isomerase n=1 Tax=Petrachloros mirabilis ULC683 TaxID=2781853 RepID=A0A8K2ANB8_9CYAN|nr:1-(5-phosphoribosyl)-5-[(5-phosphoribosylamino)methylideneamino]imidazole-4-carboxamide isomerase [Petrachloros mirabilis]NCJ05313.1 1-(5-phosphoribosyl)-5-[(5-phosphoribosylamino)methylideneamino]imidazole-4-carboxamide isomerase [Petrachloros mirabilis ULC683]
MDVIPAIDLLGGCCVRLYQGDYNQSEVFAEDPVVMAQTWADEGASWLHLVDLDGAKTGQPVNLESIERIVKAVEISIQVGGGLRDRQRVQQLLDLGVQRVILGTVAIEQPSLVAELCQDFPGQVVVGIDARGGKVATRGWLETSEINAIDLAQQMETAGAAAIIYTDIQRDGTLQGPNLEALKEMAEVISLPVIASGGVSSVADLLNLSGLASHGVTGVIIGRALYTGDIMLREALRAAGINRWLDVPPDLDTSTYA